MEECMRFRLFSICSIALLAAACSQSDAGITTSVKSRLIADDQVKAAQINVDTNKRVVTLTGEVQTGQEESRAVKIAQGTKSVTQVVNRPTVVPEETVPP